MMRIRPKIEEVAKQATISWVTHYTTHVNRKRDSVVVQW